MNASPGPSAASAGLWATLEALAGQGTTLVTLAILARLIGPADFGLFAIASFFSNLANSAIISALSSALIQKSSSTSEEESTLFWFSLIFSTAISLVIAAISSHIGAVFESDTLLILLLIVAIQLVFSGASVVPGALLVRQLRFDTLTKIALASSSISAFAAVTAAFMGAGVWSLAIQTSTASAINTLAIWLASGWRPQQLGRIRLLPKLLEYSFWVGLSGILETAFSQGAGLLIGRVHGSHNLGLFDRARLVSALPGNLVISIIARAALPMLSSRNHDRAAQREGMRHATSIAMLTTLPMIATFIAIPDLILELLLGKAWLQAAPMLAILALSSALLPLHAINLQLLLANGRAGTYFRLEIIKKIAGISCILLGIKFGIVGIAWGYVAASGIALVINTAPTKNILGYGLVAQLSDITGLTLCACAMGITMFGLRPFLDFEAFGLTSILLIAGSLAFILVAVLLRVNAVSEAWHLLRLATSLDGRAAR